MIYISHLISDEDMIALQGEQPLGIESIEFSIGYNLDKLEEKICAYQSRLDKMAFSALSVHGPFLDLNPASNDTMIREVTKVRFEQAYYAAKCLKADKIIYHSCFLPRVNFLEGWVELMVPFWKSFLEDKDDSIKIYMENVFDPEYEPLREVVEQTDHPAFSLCLDIGHANHASAKSLPQWIAGLGETIGHVHIHDNDGITDGHLALGNGSLPVDEILYALGKYSPNACFTIENCGAEDIKTTLQYLRTHADGASSILNNI